MSSILINFSGHTLCKDAVEILTKKYELIINSDPIVFDFDGEIDVQISDVFMRIPHVLDGSVPLAIIPPGQSTLAILLVSYLHGIIGHFPLICYLQMSENGLYLPRAEYTISPQFIRTSGRKYRTTMFKTS